MKKKLRNLYNNARQLTEILKTVYDFVLEC